jgi:SET domain-containing protein
VDDVPSSFLTASAEGRAHNGSLGRGVFAVKTIRKGETIAVWGGCVIGPDKVRALPREEKRLMIEVEEDRFLYSTTESPADWVNHSCDPNSGLSGQIVLVAMRNIAVGEEITFDYAMSDGNRFEEFVCFCGTARCRTRVTRDDWRKRELWLRYAGYFSPHIQRRIEKLRAAPTADVNTLLRAQR